MSKVQVTNTAQFTAAAKLAIVLSGELRALEAEGQRELVASSVLPARGLFSQRAAWEALGVKILEEDAGRADPLFCKVELPVGWKKVPAEHTVWTDLVDATGKVVANIYYKAAFYDRSAHVTLREGK